MWRRKRMVAGLALAVALIFLISVIAGCASLSNHKKSQGKSAGDKKKADEEKKKEKAKKPGGAKADKKDKQTSREDDKKPSHDSDKDKTKKPGKDRDRDREKNDDRSKPKGVGRADDKKPKPRDAGRTDDKRPRGDDRPGSRPDNPRRKPGAPTQPPPSPPPPPRQHQEAPRLTCDETPDQYFQFKCRVDQQASYRGPQPKMPPLYYEDCPSCPSPKKIPYPPEKQEEIKREYAQRLAEWQNQSDKYKWEFHYIMTDGAVPDEIMCCLLDQLLERAYQDREGYVVYLTVRIYWQGNEVGEASLNPGTPNMRHIFYSPAEKRQAGISGASDFCD